MRLASPRKLVKWTAVVLAALVAVAALGALYFVRRLVSDARAHQIAELSSHRDAFLDDERRLAALPLFAPRPGHADAGPLLAPRLRWRGLKGETPGALALDDGTRAALGAESAPVPPELAARADVAWMAALPDLDTWDVDAGAPPVEAPLWSAIPDMRDLASWAQLRLARDGDRAAAIAEVEALARLCVSTADLGVELIGVSLLRRAARARREAGLAGGVGEDDRARLWHVLFAARAFATLTTPPEGPNGLDGLAVGRCGALAGGLGIALFLRPDLRDAHVEAYARLDAALARATECPLTSLRSRWSAADAALPPEKSRLWQIAFRLPPLRRARAEVLLAISGQDWFLRYRDAK